MMAVLRRNPELVKAMVASGLQRSAVMVAITLGTQNLRVMVWRENTAQYTAMLSMCSSVLAMTTSGAFGRFGDRFGRRVAACIFGLSSFLPAWALMIFGFSATGLYASSAAFVLSGLASSTDAMLVLANDATREEDRAMAFGLFQTFTNAVTFLLFGMPALLSTIPGAWKPSITIWLMYQLVLGLLYFALVLTVRIPERAGEPSTDAAAAATATAAPAPASEVEAPEEDAESQLSPLSSGGRRTQEVGNKPGKSRCATWMLSMLPMYSQLELAWRNKNLRCLYITSIFLFFSGDLTFDLGSQYFRDELDLTKSGTLEQEQTISVLSTLPPQLFVIPATAFTGYLAQQWGSLKLLKVLIPVSAVMTSAGVVMAIFPYMWVVPLVCLAQNFAALADKVPLKHLVAEAAPRGRVGEAMGTLGMVGQAISFLGNAVVASTTPTMYHYLEKPLWIYFLACGALTLLSALPIQSMAGLSYVEEQAGRHSKFRAESEDVTNPGFEDEAEAEAGATSNQRVVPEAVPARI